jgi:NAD(P)H-hydrate epimerase
MERYWKMIVSPLTREQVRQVDQMAMQQYGMSGLVLMENAGRGAAEIIDPVAGNGLVTLLCGRGNNGGDGYVIARHLELLARQVRIISVVPLERLAGDAKTNAEIATRAGIEIQIATESTIGSAIAGSKTIIDCLLGTGAQGPPRGVFAAAVQQANALSTATRVAIDIPTGLDCDSGQAHEPTFRADHTITFVARKVGFDQPTAAAYLGTVHEVGIGVPVRLLNQISRSN